MHVHGIDHLEFYVGDPEGTAELLRAGYGFRITGRGGPETGLTGQRTLLLRQGAVRILVTAGLTPDHPASEYVARHGDGVAVVGFAVTDLDRVFETATAHGAQIVSPPTAHGPDDDRVATATVSGFGDVVHRLVERLPEGTAFLPGAVEEISTGPGSPDDLLQEIDHLAICLPAGDLAGTVRFYQEAFGFEEIFEEYIEVGEQGMESKVVQSPSGRVTFTLIQPDLTHRPGQIDDFLSWHDGAGVQHVAFRTGDIVTTVRTLARRGVRFAPTPASYYEHLEARLGPVEAPLEALRELGVLVDRDHWGQMFQIFTRSVHPRRTLFLEIIERHGARTFGSSNIKALYEAKERELTADKPVAATDSGSH